MNADPFGTASLRKAVLIAWAASPSRFREDANAEEALAVGGYAGRVLVELASNAADAAREIGVPARIRLRLVGDELRVANTGALLSAAGVAALSSLRASAKRETFDSVGHFGVGFTAVLSVSDTPRVLSTAGGVRFDPAATRAEVAGLGVAGLDREVIARTGEVPVLRLPWPTDPTEPPPPAGYQTEVRLPLKPGLLPDVRRLLADPSTAEDMFWSLTDLAEIDLPDRVVRCGIDEAGLTVIDDGGATRRYRTAERTGEIPAALLADRPIEERGRSRWRITWALPVRDLATGADIDLGVAARALLEPAERQDGTVGAPTPTDEPVTLPARLIGTFPVDDTRRRLAAGLLLDHLLDRAADTYLDLLAGADPADRWTLLPAGGFPAGPIDGALRSAILRRVEVTPLLETAAGDVVTPPDACLLPGLGAHGTVLLAQAVPGLLPPQSTAAATVLRGLGVRSIGWSDASAALAGIDREPAFWWQLYDAFEQAERLADPEELADIPIPLTGGRRAIGARGCLLPSAGRIDSDLARRAGRVIPSLRIIEPEAAHPFLERLGARPADPDTLLADPGLAAAIQTMRSDLDDADPDPDDVHDLAAVVLDLLAAGGELPAVGGGDRVGVAGLVLTDDDGQPWPASELLVPGAPLSAVLAPDADRPVVGREWSRGYPIDVLVAAGVRSGFAVVAVDDPSDEHLDLPELDDWLDRVADPAGGEPFTAVADLDLVDPDRWLAALELMASDREARASLAPTRAGLSYSGWWMSRHASIAGRAPADWRLPAALDLDGLYEPLPVALDAELATAIGVRTGLAQAVADDPAEVLDRLADPHRTVPAGRVAAITQAVVGALADRHDVDLPVGVRCLSGDVTDADDACVLDQPWLAQLLPPDRLVPGGPDPAVVAAVLDLPLASTLSRSTELSEPSAEDPQVIQEQVSRAAAALGVPAPPMVTADPNLRVALDGAEPMPVRWWGGAGRYWTDGSAESAGRVVAWTAGRWADRLLAIAAAAGDPVALAEDALS